MERIEGARQELAELLGEEEAAKLVIEQMDRQ